MFHATVGPQDALMLPVGWIFAERVGATCDCVGLKMSILRTQDLPQLEGWSKLWISQASQNAVLDAVIDALTLLE